jgi:hypothetical protein
LAKPRRQSLRREIQLIRRSLASIIRSLVRIEPALEAATTTGPRESAPPVRRVVRLSPARRAALKLQGQYMGHLRNLKPRQKASVKALRESKGIRPAIALAKKLSSG